MTSVWPAAGTGNPSLQPVPPVNWYGYLDQEGKERMVKEAGEALKELFKVEYKAMRESLGLRKPPPADRLAHYTSRPPAVWALYQRRRPDLYKEQNKDFENLAKSARLRLAARGLSLEQPAPTEVGE